MPRLARLDIPNAIHHVMGRGIEGRKIFRNNNDRQDFIKRLKSLVSEGAWNIYAWCLIPNHFHILVRTRDQSLATSMRRLLTGYVVNFNKRYNRHGHLFQNRYKSIVCQEDYYLQELVRYIHLNPLRAGLVKDINELNRFPWAGHSALVGEIERKWQDTGYVFSYFGQEKMGQSNYMKYMKEGAALGHRPELVGGGLIRSLGGWSEVLALRRRGLKEAHDYRVLGDGAFVQAVKTNLEDTVKKNLRVTDHRMDIKSIAERLCEINQISINELCSGSRRREIVKSRKMLSIIGVYELGYCGADIARFLGVTTSCVTRTLAATPYDPEVVRRNYKQIIHDRVY